jgi:hypothetical protein
MAFVRTEIVTQGATSMTRNREQSEMVVHHVNTRTSNSRERTSENPKNNNKPGDADVTGKATLFQPSKGSAITPTWPTDKSIPNRYHSCKRKQKPSRFEVQRGASMVQPKQITVKDVTKK